MGATLVFYFFAAIIALCSLMVVTQKNPVTAAMFLVCDLFFVAGLYALLGAEFVAAIQVIVYAGAILVLFMFVIMLLNLDPATLRVKIQRSVGEWLTAGLLFAGLLVLIIGGLCTNELSQSIAEIPNSLAADPDNTLTVGLHLFSSFLWPFELASLLILLAVVASIVIAKKTSVEQQLSETLSARKGGHLGTP